MRLVTPGVPGSQHRRRRRRRECDGRVLRQLFFPRGGWLRLHIFRERRRIPPRGRLMLLRGGNMQLLYYLLHLRGQCMHQGGLLRQQSLRSLKESLQS